MVLPSPISTLLLELGHVLVALFNHAELVNSLLVIREIDNPLLMASFPSHAEGSNNTL